MTFYCECSHWFCCLIQVLVWTILSSGQQLQMCGWLQIPAADVSFAVNTSVLQLTSTPCVNPLISALRPPFARHPFVSQHIHVITSTIVPWQFSNTQREQNHWLWLSCIFPELRSSKRNHWHSCCCWQQQPVAMVVPNLPDHNDRITTFRVS